MLLQDIARYEMVVLAALQPPATCLHALHPSRPGFFRAKCIDIGQVFHYFHTGHYVLLLQDIARYEMVMLAALQQPATCLHFLRPGRLVRIREGPIDWGWGIVVSVMRKTVAVNAAAQAEDSGPASAYILDLLLSCDAASIKGMHQSL